MNKKVGNNRYTPETRKKINKNRALYKENRNRAIVQSARQKPCTDCGIQYPWYVMESDHVPCRGKVSFRIAGGRIGHVSLNVLLAEIAKCDIACANCHNIRTYFRASPLEYFARR